MELTGPAADALNTLTLTQIQFLQPLPKSELHAHLNGSIPLPILQELASEYLASSSGSSAVSNDTIKLGIEALSKGPVLDEIHDFVGLFPAIYTLTSTPAALGHATRAVLSAFLGGDAPQCKHLQLGTTPRQTDAMDREKYLHAVPAELDRYELHHVGLIVSLDRRMEEEVFKEMRTEGGDPTAGDMAKLEPYLAQVKKAGLGLTIHIAETVHNTPEETLKLLSYNPNRLGHATFLNDEAISIVLEKKMCIEICLTSNLICKTVSTLEVHHIVQYLKADHPIAICTDDILPFKTSLVAEYALLLSKPPYGLGLTEGQVRSVGEMSLDARFR